MADKSFYVVFVENGKVPNKEHETREKALAEAKRLCKLEGKRTWVCQVLDVCETEVKHTELS